VIVSVNVPDAAMVPVPLTKVWKLPKLEPVGVFKLVDPRPVKVISSALPMPPRKVTELLPLPEQPAQVKIPDVVKVTGSAFAVEAPIAMKPASTTVITIVFINRAMFLFPLSNTSFDIAALQSNLVCGKLTDGEQTIALPWT
jgi:hypothetical protein